MADASQTGFEEFENPAMWEQVIPCWEAYNEQYKIHLTTRLLKLIREFKNYIWNEDQAGKTTNEPIDKLIM